MRIEGTVLDMGPRFGELILGASQSIDALVQLPSSPYFIFGDIIFLADQRLKRRWLFGEEFLSPVINSVKESHFSDLKELGWVIRHCRKPATMNFVLFDDKAAFIEPLQRSRAGLESPGHAIVVTQTNLVDEFKGLFDTLWNEPEVIYEESSNIWTTDGQQRISIASENEWNRIIAELGKNPELLYELAPRKFEELIANLLERDGLDVQLTPAQRDGGRDILAFADTAVGRHLYLVECKRYSKNNPVGVSLVRALFGAVASEKATAGLLVTTSRFTKGAIEFGSSVRHQMGFKNYKDLVQWIRYSERKK